MVDANLKQTIFNSVLNGILILLVTPLVKHSFILINMLYWFSNVGVLELTPDLSHTAGKFYSITIKNNGTQTNDENLIKPPWLFILLVTVCVCIKGYSLAISSHLNFRSTLNNSWS